MTTTIKRIVTGSRLGKLPLEVVNVGRPGDPPQIIVHRGKIFVYNPDGQTLIDGGYIASRAIAASAITTSKVSIGSKQFFHNIVFTATDADTSSWTSGTMKFADGSYVNVNAGNTGNLTEKNYIYFNNSATLQKTQYYNVAIGSNNIPIAIIEPTSDSGGKCIITSFLSGDTTIDGDTITTGRIETSNSQTHFDLNDNRIIVHDGVDNRVIIGKISTGVYGIKVSLQGYDAITDTNIRHFALWTLSSDSNNYILIKEKTRGSRSIGAWSSSTVAHGLAYVPFCLVFVLTATGTYTKSYGYPGWGDNYFIVNGTNLILYNSYASTRTFKYYIFYDQMTT